MERRQVEELLEQEGYGNSPCQYYVRLAVYPYKDLSRFVVVEWKEDVAPGTKPGLGTQRLTRFAYGYSRALREEGVPVQELFELLDEQNP